MPSDKEHPQIAVLQTIMELELHAAYATVHAHLLAHPGLTYLVLRVDNMAACFALVKGRTQNPRSGMIVAAYLTLLDRARARVYVADIKTDRNTAAARSTLASLHDLCAQRGPFVKLFVDRADLLFICNSLQPVLRPFCSGL